MLKGNLRPLNLEIKKAESPKEKNKSPIGIKR